MSGWVSLVDPLGPRGLYRSWDSGVGGCSLLHRLFVMLSLTDTSWLSSNPSQAAPAAPAATLAVSSLGVACAWSCALIGPVSFLVVCGVCAGFPVSRS